MSIDTPGTVYLINFSDPVGHNRHYRGWTGRADWADRFREHVTGRGAKLTRRAVRLGVEMTVVRTWPGTPAREKQIKQQGSAFRQCPVCTPMKRMYPDGYKKRKTAA